MLKTKIFIIEDNPILLELYEEILSEEPSFIVTGCFESVEESIPSAKSSPPDVILMDIGLPGVNGIEGLKMHKKINSKVLTIMITVHEESNTVFEALKAGAIGYLTKTTSPDELIAKTKEAISGGAPMSANIARKVITFFQSPDLNELTGKENEVANSLASGMSYASIAREMDVSVNTIKYHIRNIYEKLHVNSKQGLIDIIQKN
ncbi:response regulator transcription factor [Aureibacter tunicatorum]|uniref:DNA-binding NarL/FixJ family response regulator n=1 Tax=Aureibacter tunicatorum TaxID=866807 RepID=A0AAE3XQU2_9BACT|nr:response regulator transcription factor [Aureibacter tunicatorum]MDR6241068.1 DNA-binding NarL/FixJ family response regulator [Aureibacter tunicatorum]BDD03846.1 DNA-binding response regulator [Aureibacter tunicatorum]